MLVAAAALVVVGLLASLPRALRVRRRARELSRSLAANQNLVRALFGEQARLREEAGRMTQPQRRLLRWLRHPLVGALWASYRIRRRRRRSGSVVPDEGEARLAPTGSGGA